VTVAGIPMRWIALAAAGVLAFAAGLWLLLTPPPGPAMAFADPDDAGLVERGGQVYAEACAECHGDRLQGQPDWRTRKPDGRLPAPPHDATGHTWHHDDATLIGITRLGPGGFSGTDYQSDMPAYAGVLSDADIVAVIAFIKSTWPAEIRARQAQLNRQAQGQAR
jgi:mono/diheme cytochrome c family protein